MIKIVYVYGDTYITFLVTPKMYRFSGSTLAVMGQYLSEGEMAIMGGTGEFAMARGVIKFRTVKNTAHESYKQLDIHTFYVPTRVSKIF